MGWSTGGVTLTFISERSDPFFSLSLPIVVAIQLHVNVTYNRLMFILNIDSSKDKFLSPRNGRCLL